MPSPSALFPSLESVLAPAEGLQPQLAVLLVEDEDALAELLKHLLRRLKVQVYHAADGASALRLLEEHRSVITLAFVDCHLPDMGGSELCEALRLHFPGLPLLLTSGRDQRALEATLTGGGPCSFLPKPYMPAEVMRRVSALLPAAA